MYSCEYLSSGVVLVSRKTKEVVIDLCLCGSSLLKRECVCVCVLCGWLFLDCVVFLA